MTGSRLDADLVRRGLARSRGHARELIAAGVVTVDGQVATKPATEVHADRVIALTRTQRTWVSRGSVKLLAALDAWPQVAGAVRGGRCIDVGASTGGFTEVLLERGAAQIEAIDVGHGQLADSVRADPRVRDHSGMTVRAVAAESVGGPAGVVVTDLSFISLTTVLPDLARLMEPSGHLVALVKPQFEVGRERLGKKGIVRSLVEHRRVLASVVEAATASRLHVRGLLQSPISGSQGNVEYLMWAMSPPCVKMDPAAIAQEIVALTTPPGREARTTGGLR